MRKIKILEVTPNTTGCYECGNDDVDYLVTDWDEVDDKDYETIIKWAVKKNKKAGSGYGRHDSHYYVVAEYNESIPGTVADYLKMIREEKEKAAEKKKKTEERKKKREAEKAEQKKKIEQDLFKELKKKYEPR
jgi:hypothetical protein